MNAASTITKMLGNRCAATYILSCDARDAFQDIERAVGDCTELYDIMDIRGIAVLDVPKARNEARKEALLAVDNSRAGAHISPAIMRGADIVVDDLSAMAPGFDVCAVSVSERALHRERMADTLSQLQDRYPVDLALMDKVDERAAAYEEWDKARNDVASEFVPYLVAHPKVAAVAWAGRKDTDEYEVARRVFERGFGHVVFIEFVEGVDAGQVKEALGKADDRTTQFVTFYGHPRELVAHTGSEDVKKLVERFEAALK